MSFLSKLNTNSPSVDLTMARHPVKWVAFTGRLCCTEYEDLYKLLPLCQRCCHSEKHGRNSTFTSAVSHSLTDFILSKWNDGYSHPEVWILIFLPTSPDPQRFLFFTEPIKLNSHKIDMNWEHGTTTVVKNWNHMMPLSIIPSCLKQNVWISYLPLLPLFIWTKTFMCTCRGSDMVFTSPIL